MSKLANATAIITLTVEIESPSCWGHECSIGQAMRQASREAVDEITKILGPLGRRLRLVRSECAEVRMKSS